MTRLILTLLGQLYEKILFRLTYLPIDMGYYSCVKRNYYDWFRNYGIDNDNPPSLYNCCIHMAQMCYAVKEESIVSFWKKSTITNETVNSDEIVLIESTAEPSIATSRSSFPLTLDVEPLESSFNLVSHDSSL